MASHATKLKNAEPAAEAAPEASAAQPPVIKPAHVQLAEQATGAST